MALGKNFEQRFNTPAKPDPLPLAQEQAEQITRCPACSVEVRPGAVLCVACGARMGRIETVAPPGMATRAPCIGCGYDLSGVMATTCPECGRPAPFAPAPLNVMTEEEEAMQRRVVWETCRPAVFFGAIGLAVLVTLAGWWYGVKGVQFWLAAIGPTWVAAAAGYFVLGSILRFLDTSVGIALVQVLGVVLVGLAITQLTFPVTGGKVWISLWTMLLMPALVTGTTMLVMDDDDRFDCFLASLPITLACLVMPLVLFVIVR